MRFAAILLAVLKLCAAPESLAGSVSSDDLAEWDDFIHSMAVLIQEETAKLIADVYVPLACLNTDTDTCCELTVKPAIMPYFEHLKFFVPDKISWHSNVYQVTDKASRDTANRQAKWQRMSVVKFVCRFAAFIAADVDTLDFEFDETDGPVDEQLPFAQHVLMNQRSAPYFPMTCKYPFEAQYHDVYRHKSEFHDTIGICVDTKNDPGKVERVLSKAGVPASTLNKFEIVLGSNYDVKETDSLKSGGSSSRHVGKSTGSHP